MEKISTQNIFARNCDCRRIPKNLAKEFLDKYHTMGYTNCRYAYGLFTKKLTKDIEENVLVGVATFSSAKKWQKGNKLISSYEWIRYACLSGYRINGGMSKILKCFIDELGADDIMTYIDPTWSNGEAYKALGFKEEGLKTFKSGASSIKFRLKITDY